MFKHLFSYVSKIYIKSSQGSLFSIILPLALGLIFLFAFEGLTLDGDLEPIPLGLVYHGDEDENFGEFLDMVGIEGAYEDGAVMAKKGTDQEAKYLLYYKGEKDEIRDLVEEGKLTGEVHVRTGEGNFDLSLYIPTSKANDMKAYILYTIFDTYQTSYRNIERTMERLGTQVMEGRNPRDIEAVAERLEEGLDQDGLIQTRYKDGINTYTNFFLAALGFISVYFVRVGSEIIRTNETYIDSKAMRMGLSPLSKGKRILVSFLALTIPSLLVMYILVLVYWQRDIGLSKDYANVLLILSLAVLVAIALGMAINSWIKVTDERIEAINLLIPILGAGASGLMGEGSFQLKVFLQDKAPLLSKLNLVSLVNDGLYQLSYYPNQDRFYGTIRTMVFYLFVLIALILLGQRREKV